MSDLNGHAQELRRALFAATQLTAKLAAARHRAKHGAADAADLEELRRLNREHLAHATNLGIHLPAPADAETRAHRAHKEDQ